MSPTLWLSCHVDYACRHRGACCRSGWPLPVETRVVAGIDRAMAGGRLRTLDGSSIWLVTAAEAPEDMAGTLRQVDGGCVFHQPVVSPEATPGGQRHCAVHGTLGAEALPASCRHFPRVCLIDDRGARVTLSHYCPTAAAMLVDHTGPIAIVPGPSPVPGLEAPEGLDARHQLPPRLSAGVLGDWIGLSAWETHIVDTLAGPSADSETPESALATLARDAAALGAWRPGRESLLERVGQLHASWRQPQPRGDSHTFMPASVLTRFAIATDACRAPWTWADAPRDLADLDARWVQAAWSAHAAAIRRYLASKAFAAWVAYQADATRALIAWLEVALAVLRVESVRQCQRAQRPLDRALLTEAIRQSDLLLVHYADPARLAALVARR